MTIEKVKESQELLTLIKITEEGLENLKKLRDRAESEFLKRGREKGKILQDNNYNLCISEYGDGSGYSAVLQRYFGNEELLNIVIETLERQLAEYQKLFEAL